MYVRFLLLFLLAGILLGCNHVRPDTVGVVYEFDGQIWTPLANAKVNVECLQYTGIHGSKTVKHLTYPANKDGVYKVPGVDLIPCNFMFTRPAKEGYVDLFGPPLSL